MRREGKGKVQGRCVRGTGKDEKILTLELERARTKKIKVQVNGSDAEWRPNGSGIPGEPCVQRLRWITICCEKPCDAAENARYERRSRKVYGC